MSPFQRKKKSQKNKKWTLLQKRKKNEKREKSIRNWLEMRITITRHQVFSNLLNASTQQSAPFCRIQNIFLSTCQGSNIRKMNMLTRGLMKQHIEFPVNLTQTLSLILYTNIHTSIQNFSPSLIKMMTINKLLYKKYTLALILVAWHFLAYNKINFT
jgi:hypothetical protein